MASLLALPDELKALILADLTTSDLLNLVATCKTFHGFTRPLAYQHLTLNWRNADAERHSPDLNILNRVLANDPILEHSIRHLTFATNGCIDFDTGNVNIAWNGYREDGVPHLCVQLMRLITRCVELQSLEISIALLRPYKFFYEGLIDDASTEDREWMRNLKFVRMTFDNGEKSDWMPQSFSLRHEHRCLLLLPRVEVIDLAYWDPCDAHEYRNDIYEEDEDDHEEEFWSLYASPNAQHLTTLKLGFSPAPAAMFELFLRRTPNLRIFEVEVCQRADMYEFRLDQFKAGLNHVKSRLKHLKMRYDVYPRYEDGSSLSFETTELHNVVAGRLGSFKDYPTLTYLETSLHLLFGSHDSLEGKLYPLSSVLPPNLEELVVTDDLYGFEEFQQYFEDADAMKIFETYLDEWRDVTPMLKRLAYDLRERGEFTVRYWDEKQNRNAFRRLCKAKGIDGKLLWSY